MSTGNEVTEMWAEVRIEQQAIHAKRKADNIEQIRGTRFDILVRNDGDVLLFRDRHYPAIDFYPSTNKWKVGNRTMMGDANALISFLERNRKA